VVLNGEYNKIKEDENRDGEHMIYSVKV